jgi:hypothetical protein
MPMNDDRITSAILPELGPHQICWQTIKLILQTSQNRDLGQCHVHPVQPGGGTHGHLATIMAPTKYNASFNSEGVTSTSTRMVLQVS